MEGAVTRVSQSPEKKNVCCPAARSGEAVVKRPKCLPPSTEGRYDTYTCENYETSQIQDELVPLPGVQATFTASAWRLPDAPLARFRGRGTIK